MGNLLRAGTKWILLACCVVLAARAHAACNGPQAMVAKLHAHPTTDNAIVLGSWYASQKQFDCAAATFKDALKADPNSAQLHYLEGLALVGAGHASEAIPSLRESVRLDSKVIKPHLMLAFLYDNSGSTKKQWSSGSRLSKSTLRSVAALEGLAADLLSRQDYVGVVTLLRNAPHSEKIAIDLAQAFGNLNYLDDANKCSPRQ